ncbi:NYN domain-containing protein [Candidatus Fermentibacteria bacterium]|nr:NYN domain-containing protein [Candidatus Fermentibacteria bacterium]
MRYLVDGSNVLGSRGELNTPGAPDRLLWAIERFCKRGRSTALVIFDGMEGRSPGGEFSIGERVRARVASAIGTADRADREIIAKIPPHGAEGTIVVTSDAALAAAARCRMAQVVDSVSFVRQVEATGARVRDEKEAAAAGVDNAELLRLWRGNDSV